MTDVLQHFVEFLADEGADDMYLTGKAGTGKTTNLAEMIQHCQRHNISYVVCAYTHKACDVIRDTLAMSVGGEILCSTLHSYLTKVPTINDKARRLKHVESNKVIGSIERVQVVFIDEYSFIGEQDLMDIREVQDGDEDKGVPPIKIVWLGDPNQLPPVGDVPAVRPHGSYDIRLTKVYRQAEHSPLLDTLDLLVDWIEGRGDPHYLPAHEALLRDRDVVEEYRKSACNDKILLAYTNRRVEEMNAALAPKGAPNVIFCPSMQTYFKFLGTEFKPTKIYAYRSVIELNTKYKTLEHLTYNMAAEWPIEFFDVRHPEGGEMTLAVVFGHHTYKMVKEQLKQAAVEANKAIPDDNITAWCRMNPNTDKARNRARAWRDFLTFDKCVVCVDHPYATTIHKSQGSTFKEVYVDTQDVAIAGNFSMNTYLKLLYVAFSRASDKVITNQE